jgi:hypothetical protein
MANEKKKAQSAEQMSYQKDAEIESLSDAALEEVAGGADQAPTGSPLCPPPDEA